MMLNGAVRMGGWSNADRGVHPPEAMMHFLPFFRFPPLFPKHFLTFSKISQISHFPEKIPHFYPPKFLTTFFSTTNFAFPPIFHVLVHFPPDSRKFIISPLTFQNSPFSKNSTAFYILYVYFPPYFDHDAFMHHPMHVLDAPECGHLRTGVGKVVIFADVLYG